MSSVVTAPSREKGCSGYVILRYAACSVRLVFAYPGVPNSAAKGERLMYETPRIALRNALYRVTDPAARSQDFSKGPAGANGGGGTLGQAVACAIPISIKIVPEAL